MAAHGPGFGVFVLGVQGHKHRQAGADGLGYIADGVEIADGPGEELLDGEVFHLQQGGQVGLRLGLGKFLNGLLCGGPEDVGVACPHLLGLAGVGVLPQPHPRLDKAGQVAGQLGPVALLFQGEKLVEESQHLVGPEDPPLGGHGQVGENGLVVIPRQHPGPVLLSGGGLPGRFQQLGGLARGCGGGPAIIPLGKGSPGFGLKGLGGLGGPHVVPVPHGEGVVLHAAVAGLGEKLGDELVGPAPAFELPWRPELSW